MRFSLHGLVRLMGMLGLLACSVAIFIARLEPTPMRLRVAVAPPYGVINGFLLEPTLVDSRFLEVDTGTVRPLSFSSMDRFDFATCSPWEDEEGECQLVGRWARRELDTSGTVVQASGLARYSWPSGRVLNQIPLDIVPSSQPCWFPDRSSRVLYSGSDGRLYRMDFGAGGTPTPEPVVWRADKPGTNLIIRDPVWSSSPRLKGVLIFSLSFRAALDENRLHPGRLWWARLDDKASAILEAGPLDLSGRPDSEGGEDRFPNIATTADGQVLLAWLYQPVDAWRWELRLAPLRIDGDEDVPTCRMEEVRTLAKNHIPQQPPFSTDGRFVYSVGTTRMKAGRIEVLRHATVGEEVAPEAPRVAQVQPAAHGG